MKKTSFIKPFFKAALPTALLWSGQAWAAQEAAPQAAQGGFAGAVLQMIAALALVLAILVGLYWLARRFLPSASLGGGGKMRILGRLGLGARKQVVMLEVAGKTLVLGVSQDRITLLTSLEDGGGQPPADQAGEKGFVKALRRAQKKEEPKP